MSALSSEEQTENNFSKEDAYQALELVNSWTNNADTKISFVLAYIAVLIGFVFYNAGAVPNAIQSFLSATQKSSNIVFGAVLVVFLYLCCLVSVVLFFLAIFGRIKNTSGEKSAFFFGTVSTMTLDDYRTKAVSMTDQDIVQDILEQIHTNSKICTKKFKLYNCGIYFLVASTFLCFLCMIFQLIC
jgi:hypothetical protein